MQANHHTKTGYRQARWAAIPALLLCAGIASAAPLAYTDVYSVKVDNTAGVALNLLANDQGTAPLTLTAINGTTLTGSAQDIAVTGGVVRVAAGGAISFVPDGSAIGTSSFSYTVTDSTGTTAYNQMLSQARAQSVARALQTSGMRFDADQIIGRGETIPLSPNDTAEGRQDNRRVVVIVTPPA